MDQPPIPRLPIERLADRHSGLTVAISDSYAEAARVCLDRHHESPVGFNIDSCGEKTNAEAEWEQTNDRTRMAWANEVDTTEAGAYACTLAAVELCQSLFAIRRAETKVGADYYIAPVGTPADDLESCLRLEVSGLDRGSEAAVAYRLKSKLEQAAAGRSNLPAMAGVVGFEARLILLANMEDR